MTDNVWRDEQRLPIVELDKAMATSPLDGQSDDLTGNDAGEESAFGHGPIVADGHTAYEADHEREASDGQRVMRPSPTGRTGPDV